MGEIPIHLTKHINLKYEWVCYILLFHFFRKIPVQWFSLTQGDANFATEIMKFSTLSSSRQMCTFEGSKRAHSNSSEIPTELNEFTEVKRSFCKETFLESQIRQFSENGFIWKWRIWSGYSAKSYPKERDRHILIFGSMYETESKLSP